MVSDEARDVSLPHLIFLKELTDQLQVLPPPQVVGVCLVAAGRGASMPLKEVFDQEDNDVAAISTTIGSGPPLWPDCQPYGGGRAGSPLSSRTPGSTVFFIDVY